MSMITVVCMISGIAGAVIASAIWLIEEKLLEIEYEKEIKALEEHIKELEPKPSDPKKARMMMDMLKEFHEECGVREKRQNITYKGINQILEKRFGEEIKLYDDVQADV